jgi:hypothetical protein
VISTERNNRHKLEPCWQIEAGTVLSSKTVNGEVQSIAVAAI